MILPKRCARPPNDRRSNEDKPNARIEPPEPAAKPQPKNQPRRRAPAPANDGMAEWSRVPEFIDGGLHPITLSGLDSLSPEGRAAALTVEDGPGLFDVAIRAHLDGDDQLYGLIKDLRSEDARLTTELAQLRAKFAEAKAEFGEARHILERLQITREGKRGERGPCGADGAPGLRGERGPRGERDKSAPTIIEWRPDPEAFTIQAIRQMEPQGR